MSWRRILWWLAFLLLLGAAVIAYSPRLERHRHSVAFVGLAAFVLGWLVSGSPD